MASDIFAKIGDIKGESQHDRHRDEIEVASLSWGLTNAPAAGTGGGAAGKPQFQPIAFVHTLDRASPSLMLACATGRIISEATITQHKAGNRHDDYLIIKLRDVIITSVIDATVAGQAPAETVTLAFGRIELEYKAQRPDGSLESAGLFKFDVKANRPL